MKKGMSNVMLALIFVALLTAVGVFWVTHGYAGVTRLSDLTTCNAGSDYDGDGIVNSLDLPPANCKCDPAGVAMVAKMASVRTDVKNCADYVYLCEKKAGQWSSDAQCFPKTQVQDDFVDSCGQVKGDHQQSVPLSKMVLDADGSPHKYCPTDETICANRIGAKCKENYS